MSDTAGSFEVPMVLFRVGCMDHYWGVTARDRITGGGLFVAENEYGHEMFNFQPVAGRMYG